MRGCVSRAAAAVILEDRPDEGTGTLLGEGAGRSRSMNGRRRTVPFAAHPGRRPNRPQCQRAVDEPIAALTAALLGWPLPDRRRPIVLPEVLEPRSDRAQAARCPRGTRTNRPEALRCASSRRAGSTIQRSCSFRDRLSRSVALRGSQSPSARATWSTILSDGLDAKPVRLCAVACAMIVTRVCSLSGAIVSVI